jgi:hypothetical protein
VLPRRARGAAARARHTQDRSRDPALPRGARFVKPVLGFSGDTNDESEACARAAS